MTSSTPRRSALLSVVAAGLLVVSACGGGSDEKPADKSSTATPSAEPVKDSAACSFLTAAERRQLAGVPVDTVVAADARKGSSQCRWQESAALIQLTTLPAKAWATSLPDVMAKLESAADLSSAADKLDLARAKKLLAGAATFTDAEACEAFATLAELGGAEKGARTTVTAVPITETEAGISAQTCSGGQLTSIIYSTPGLKKTKKVEKAATAILQKAQKRAAAQS